ncbi:hypothetical protein AGMMS49545_14530 [Betaproteobacteria bacterium]|nr:hypothetical protein AGMMS49545_14530 [Betaproteobacteria bacterium]GHU41589.1 hypothetical protein AGMMS50289_04970 [Betaproteobacteria bacterium]
MTRDADIAHTFRPEKVEPMMRDTFRNLPRLLRNPKAVILDTMHTQPALLVVIESVGSNAKFMVQIDYYLKKPKRGTFNVVNTGRELNEKALKTLQGELKNYAGKESPKLLLIDGEL